MPVLSTTWADGNTMHGADIDTITGAVNTPGFTSAATSAQTITMDATYNQVQVLTGSSTATVKLPTTTIPAGYQVMVINQSTGAVAVQSSGANAILSLAGSTSAMFTANIATPAVAADWIYQYGAISITGGKILSVINSITLSGTDGETFNIDAIPTSKLSGGTSIAAAVATSATAQTQMASLVVAANTLSAGQSFRLRGFGVQSTTSGTLTWQVHMGTANTTADAVITSVAPAVAASAGSNAEGLLTVRTTGSGGTCMASAIGFGSTTVLSTTTATTAVNTTVQQFVTLSVAASAGTNTVQTAVITYAEA